MPEGIRKLFFDKVNRKAESIRKKSVTCYALFALTRREVPSKKGRELCPIGAKREARFIKIYALYESNDQNYYRNEKNCRNAASDYDTPFNNFFCIFCIVINGVQPILIYIFFSNFLHVNIFDQFI